MEAPDKIYIDDLAVVNDCVTKISLKQLPNFSEYVRKDLADDIVESAEDHAFFAGQEKLRESLLEWAKEKYNKAYKLHLKKGNNYAYGQGKMDAYGKLIDQLNSM